MTILNLSIIALSLVGLMLSYKIYGNKRTKNCGRFCNVDVIDSKYGKTFGVENTLLGSLYYLFMIVVHLIPWSESSLIPMGYGWLVNPIVLGAALLAFGFSLYLVGVQSFILKKYCLLCLGTAVINVALAALIVLG